MFYFCKVSEAEFAIHDFRESTAGPLTLAGFPEAVKMEKEIFYLAFSIPPVYKLTCWFSKG